MANDPPVPLIPTILGGEDLSDSVEMLATGVYTVTQYPNTVRAGGRVQPVDPGELVTFPVAGSMQPISGRELNRLPEGLRDKELRVFFSPRQLRTTSGKDGGYPADTLTEPDGTVWEVSKVLDWSASGSFWRVVLEKRP